MKTITSTEEFAIHFLSELVTRFDDLKLLYTFDISGNEIKAFNPDKEQVLTITKSTITIRDVINDAVNIALNEQRLSNLKETYNRLLVESTSSYEIQLISEMLSDLQSEKSQKTFKSFKYFTDEAEWFQQMTVQEDILPFDTANVINELKNCIIKDLQDKWTLV